MTDNKREDAMQDGSVKNPNHEAEIPAPFPESTTGAAAPVKKDPAGQQGGTEGHGKSVR